MNEFEKIKLMNSNQLKDATVEMQKELGSYLVKQVVIRVTTVVVVRWAIRRFL